uniref:Uncharacterized protein n=1 Tax=Anguilla anguilla TaxID=7936 RepID=A0A0E9U1J7_ANGAN
MRHFEVWWS